MVLSGPALASPVDVSRLLDKGLAGDPDSTALISLETSWTWQELAEDSARLAGNLLDLGLKPGDRAASLMPNRCAVLVFYLACLKAGLVATPIYYRATPRGIDRILDASGASVLIAHRERAADLAASPSVERLAHGVVGFGQGALAGTRFDDFIDKEPEIEDFAERAADEPAFLLYVPDGSGEFRGITHSARGLGWALASVAAGYALTPDDTYLTGTALSHYGGVVQCLAALASGSRVAIARNADAAEILPLLRAEQPTVAFMLRSSMVRLVRDHEAGAKDFASLRYLACGSDQAPLSQVRDFERQIGVSLHEHFGMAALGPVTVHDSKQGEAEEEVATGTVGRILPGIEGEIRGETGYLLPAGMPGRLWLRSPSHMLGHWVGDGVVPAGNAEGWIDTGETMRADSRGQLVFAGPRRQILFREGESPALKEVEAVLMEHPGVTAAGVVRIHDLLFGESRLAFVSFAESEEPPSEQDLIAFVRSRIGYKAPEQVVAVASLPMHEDGNLDRSALRQMAENDLSQDAPAD